MNDLDPDTPLAQFLATAWDTHAHRPQPLAEALLTRAPGLAAPGTGDADAADAIRLAAHLWLAHVGDPAGLQAFVDALPASLESGAKSGPMLLRARWALATIAGQPAPTIAPAQRWAALQNVWTWQALQGRAADAQAGLIAESQLALAQTGADADPAARRALAATCNNLAAELCDGRRGDAALDALMLRAAQAAAQLWASAGTWVHVERAAYRLACCHAALGQGADAVAHAQACLDTIEAHADAPEADAAERFFAHEAMLRALHAAGDALAAAAQRARMAELLDEISDTEMAAWCRQTLAAVDALT
jgi:hypothetical protein